MVGVTFLHFMHGWLVPSTAFYSAFETARDCPTFFLFFSFFLFSPLHLDVLPPTVAITVTLSSPVYLHVSSTTGYYSRPLVSQTTENKAFRCVRHLMTLFNPMIASGTKYRRSIRVLQLQYSTSLFRETTANLSVHGSNVKLTSQLLTCNAARLSCLFASRITVQLPPRF